MNVKLMVTLVVIVLTLTSSLLMIQLPTPLFLKEPIVVRNPGREPTIIEILSNYQVRIERHRGFWQKDIDDSIQQSDYSFSYDEAAALYIALDHLFDLMPANSALPTDVGLEQIIQEAMPYFVFNDFVESATYPVEAEIDDFKGLMYLSILGASDCEEKVKISSRMENSLSPWAEGEHLFGTTVHELAHIQQGGLCINPTEENLESSAQVMMLEILASMANRGNIFALRAFVFELKSMTGRVAMVRAYHEQREIELYNLAAKVDPGAIGQAKMAANMRYYEENTQRIETSVMKYSQMPLETVFKSYLSGNVIEDLAIPKVSVKVGSNNWQYEYRTPTVWLDDLFYLLEHLEGMVQDAATVK